MKVKPLANPSSNNLLNRSNLKSNRTKSTLTKSSNCKIISKSWKVKKVHITKKLWKAWCNLRNKMRSSISRSPSWRRSWRSIWRPMRTCKRNTRMLNQSWKKEKLKWWWREWDKSTGHQIKMIKNHRTPLLLKLQLHLHQLQSKKFQLYRNNSNRRQNVQTI